MLRLIRSIQSPGRNRSGFARLRVCSHVDRLALHPLHFAPARAIETMPVVILDRRPLSPGLLRRTLTTKTWSWKHTVTSTGHDTRCNLEVNLRCSAPQFAKSISRIPFGSTVGATDYFDLPSKAGHWPTPTPSPISQNQEDYCEAGCTAANHLEHTVFRRNKLNQSRDRSNV